MSEPSFWRAQKRFDDASRARLSDRSELRLRVDWSYS